MTDGHGIPHSKYIMGLVQVVVKLPERTDNSSSSEAGCVYANVPLPLDQDCNRGALF